MQYEYFVAPFEGKLQAGGDVGSVSEQLTKAINHYVGYGWEFHSLGEVQIVVSPGCLAGLFGASTSYISHNQLVFRRERQQATGGDQGAADQSSQATRS